MPDPCCCTNEGAGHRCPAAWQLITTAVQARQARQALVLDEARMHYTTHLYQAGLLSYGSSAWPETCTATRADDPRCPQCRPCEAP